MSKGDVFRWAHGRRDRQGHTKLALEREPVAQWFQSQRQVGHATTVWFVRMGAARISTLEADLARETAPRRFQVSLLVALSRFALLLAALGVYGTMHYAVAHRTSDPRAAL